MMDDPGLIMGAALGGVFALVLVVVWSMLRGNRANRAAARRAMALDSLPQAILLTDSTGAPLFANQAWRDCLSPSGAGPGNKGGLETLKGILAPEVENLQTFVRLIAAATARDTESSAIAVIAADGHKSWYRASVQPAADGKGTLWTLSADHARNALDAAIATEQARMVQFLDDCPVGYFSVDEEGRFLSANTAFAHWVGISAEELIDSDRHLHDLLSGEQDAALPAWSALGPLSVGEVILQHASGRRFTAYVSETVLNDGNNIRTRTLIRDLSRERDTRTALRQSEERFHRFFDEAPVGIALLDANGRINECSTALARMTLGEPDTVAGRDLWDLVIDDDRDRVRQWVAGAIAANDAAPLQITLKGPDEIVASLFARRIEADSDGPGGLVVHALDQTEFRNLENQFIQSQKMDLVGQLAGGVAHDFNNLLTAMIGFCDLLLQRHSPKDQSFADIMQVKQNANRAANLVRQLLAFSRQQTLQPKVLNITNVLTELTHLLRRLIGADIELKMVHARDLWPVKVDQSQLEQVIINLAVNARDAVGVQGAVTIRTYNHTASEGNKALHASLPSGDYVVMEVADTGTGVPKELLSKIFEPFFTTKEVGSGTGLGLSTVYGIIRQTGGHIFVDSTEGDGACFTIYLPRNEAGAEISGAAVAGEAAISEKRDLTGAGRVMLVEDEDAVRMFGARALRNKGYTVVEAASGEEAIAMLANGEADAIDLLITDVVMPGLDGPSMIRQVRETHPDMKVVFISGYTEDSFRKRLDVADDIHFLPKPFTLQQLASKVKEMMEETAV
ncbi:MAG: two-component system cell cycle sensor histidine kinase/response regulator CckA [Alphaproteobacteria bacterium]|jgi:two-component system cell cycle sensor histidine kinase/response regulator CckA